jgi:uncharacterized protein YjaZ
MELELKLESELGAMVAVTVVVLSVFMAVTKLKDENVVQGMQHTQVAAVDAWNEYQAERIKLHVDENDTAALKLHSGFPGTDATALAAEIARLQSKSAHYGKQADGLAKDAHADEARYEALDFRHDQFDMADALCSIALAMSAVAALANRRALLYGGWGVAAFGILMGIAGIAGWNLHPEWLANFLG